MSTLVSSNVDDVNAWLKQVVDGFDFKLTLENETLGEDCVHVIAEEIAVRSADNRGADGYWPANEPEYAAWKLRKYGASGPNIRTGQMVSLESLLGTVTIGTHEVTMEYGTDTPPTRSSGSGYISEADKEVTDREKASYCSTERPFYEMDDQIVNLVFEHVENTIVAYLNRA